MGEKHRTEVTEATEGTEVLMAVVLSVNAPGFRARKKPRRFFHRRFTDRILWGTNPQSPSVTSVASVRCFPLLRLFLRPEATVLPIEFSGAPTQNPPSVTSVRCFPVALVSRPEAKVSV
jgi:hypothetical protein